MLHFTKQLLALLLLCLLLPVGGPATAEGNIRVTVNGTQLVFDQQPIMENDRVLVPVRAIFEALGATVEWNPENELVTAQKDGQTVKLQIGNRLMTQNGAPVLLDVGPKLVGSRTLVPVRAVSESFGAQVDWIASSLTVVVTTASAGNGSNSGDSSSESQPSQDYAYRVLELVNEERAKQGIAPLQWHDGLANVAYAHSKDMHDRNFMAHNNPDSLTPFDRIKNAGISYTRAAENVAAGQQTPEQVMQSWMNSSGHRANILNPNLTKLGVGYYKGTNGYRSYWTQVFIAQ